MHILEQLYIGNVRPGERSFKRNSQCARALDEAAKARDAPIEALSFVAIGSDQNGALPDRRSSSRKSGILSGWRSCKSVRSTLYRLTP